MLLLPVFSIIYKRAFYFFPIILIGSVPYATAFSLLMTMLLQLNIFFKKQNIHIVILGSLWISYGLILAIIRLDSYFISEIIQLGICLMICLFVYNLISNASDLNFFLILLMSSGLLLSIIEILIAFFGIQISTTSLIDSRATNYTSIYVVLAVLPFSLIYFKSIFTKILILFLCLEVTSLNEGRAMYLIALIIFSIYMLRKRTLLFNLIVFSLSIFLILAFVTFYGDSLLYVNNSIFSLLNTTTNFSNIERINLLGYSYELFKDNPFGYGIGSSAEIFRGNLITVNDHYPHPHNTLAFLAVELGMIGVIIYFYLFCALIFSVFSIKNENYRILGALLLIGLFLVSVASTIFYNGVVTIFSFIIISIIFLLKKVAGSD